MAISAESFRDKYFRRRWIFDFFADGYDFLNGRFFPPKNPEDDSEFGERWNSAYDEIKKRYIHQQIVKADGIIPDDLRHYLDIPGSESEMESPEFWMRLFVLLSAIDETASDLNYLGAASNYSSSRWANVIEHFEKNKKQLQHRADGYIVFRPRYFKQAPSQTWLDRALRDETKWKKIPHRGEYLAEHFKNLLRVFATDDCNLEFRVLRGTQDLHDLDWTNLKIGIVPLIEHLNVRTTDAQLSPGPLVLKKETSSPPTFGIQVEGMPSESCAGLCDKAEAALRYLANQGCQLVVFPEMVMPDPVVARLKNVLRELSLHEHSRPGLVLAGTFTRMVPKHSTEKPFNVAVVLNHAGEELWRQRKMQPYAMQGHEQIRFGLEKILGGKPCQENIAINDRELHVIDSPVTGLRMVVLICEDATKDPGLEVVKKLQPTLILAPVMAGPLEPTSGFGDSVGQALQKTAAIFIVNNSAALARAASKGGSPPLAIIGVPLSNVTNNYRPLETLQKLQAVPGSDVQVLIYQFPT